MPKKKQQPPTEAARISINNNQLEKDAEHILERILLRRNWSVDTRDKLAAYLALVVENAPRAGKITVRTRAPQRRFTK